MVQPHLCFDIPPLLVNSLTIDDHSLLKKKMKIPWKKPNQPLRNRSNPQPLQSATAPIGT
jgi:hypothetical protein